MKELSKRLVENNGGSVISAETDSDHIHLLIEIPPSIAPGEMVKVLKTQLSKECHQRYKEELQKYLYGEKTPLWSPSYFVATTGTAVMEKVKSYVESQRTDEHKRKYEKSGNYKKKRKYVRKNIDI